MTSSPSDLVLPIVIVPSESGKQAYERQYQERALKTLKKKALALGFDLVAKPAAPECVS